MREVSLPGMRHTGTLTVRAFDPATDALLEIVQLVVTMSSGGFSPSRLL